MVKETGLTPAEQAVMDHLVAAWNGFVDLPVQHPSDKPEFASALHRIQYLLGMRVVRREHGGWTNEENK